VRGSTVEGVIGWPAGGAGRGGFVCGIGGGAWGGAGTVDELPGSLGDGDAEGDPVGDSVGALPGKPVRGSIVEGAPDGKGAGRGDDPGPGSLRMSLCASAGPVASVSMAIVAMAREIDMAHLLTHHAESKEGADGFDDGLRGLPAGQRPICVRRKAPTAAL
jgi:hypothetical protein